MSYAPARNAGHYKPPAPISALPATSRLVTPRDDYERWYTETSTSNRMMLALRSGIDTEIGWALDRLCRLCDNDLFQLKSIPGLMDALFGWPEWYTSEGHKETCEMQSLFAPSPTQLRRRRHALESMVVLRNATMNEPHAAELMANARVKPLILSALHNLQLNTDFNAEFVLYAIDLLHLISTKFFLSPPSQQLAETNPIPPLEKIASQSSNRSLIIASLTALTLIYQNESNVAYLRADSPALQASVQYLPLLNDKPLLDACVNYLYVHLAYPPMCKAFLFHPDLSSILKILVNVLLSEQIEENVVVDITGTVHTVPVQTMLTLPHELTKEELDTLLGLGEPTRCYEWMKTMFVAKPEGELTQVDFWNLYKDVFMPFQNQYPLLVASDVIKNVNVVFPEAQAMVLPGPPQKFVVRGVDRRTDDPMREKFKCHWDRSQCIADPPQSQEELYAHVLTHLVESDASCLWGSCTTAHSSTTLLRAHLLTHISSMEMAPLPPSQSTVVTLPSFLSPYPTAKPTERNPPPPSSTIISYTTPSVDAPTTSLTALLCIRLLFRASFASSEVAPRADADHFGFPGLVDDPVNEIEADAGQQSVESDMEGERRGKRAFAAAQTLMQRVRLRDEPLMAWITEMLDN